MPPKKTYLNWSSGKDASMALFEAQKGGKLEVSKLLTSVNGHHNRVSMHGLRRDLLHKQAEALGLPLKVVNLPEQPSMEDYSKLMGEAVSELKNEGFEDCIFGDIFLEDLRAYREKQLAEVGISCHFPLWKRDTKKLLQEFITLGFKAITVCVNGQLLDESFVGREVDEAFLMDLPVNVDPCGENGEFHTFCYDGPIFKQPVKFELGEKVFREYKAPKKDEQHRNEEKIGFWFCDLAV
jgi:uncharacterized protein (TIGR00290 family)